MNSFNCTTSVVHYVSRLSDLQGVLRIRKPVASSIFEGAFIEDEYIIATDHDKYSFISPGVPISAGQDPWKAGTYGALGNRLALRPVSDLISDNNIVYTKTCKIFHELRDNILNRIQESGFEQRIVTAPKGADCNYYSLVTKPISISFPVTVQKISYVDPDSVALFELTDDNIHAISADVHVEAITKAGMELQYEYAILVCNESIEKLFLFTIGSPGLIMEKIYFLEKIKSLDSSGIPPSSNLDDTYWQCRRDFLKIPHTTTGNHYLSAVVECYVTGIEGAKDYADEIIQANDLDIASTIVQLPDPFASYYMKFITTVSSDDFHAYITCKMEDCDFDWMVIRKNDLPLQAPMPGVSRHSLSIGNLNNKHFMKFYQSPVS